MELLASTINATLHPGIEGRRSVAGKGVAARGRDQGAMSFSQMIGACFLFRCGAMQLTSEAGSDYDAQRRREREDDIPDSSEED